MSNVVHPDDMRPLAGVARCVGRGACHMVVAGRQFIAGREACGRNAADHRAGIDTVHVFGGEPGLERHLRSTGDFAGLHDRRADRPFGEDRGRCIEHIDEDIDCREVADGVAGHTSHRGQTRIGHEVPDRHGQPYIAGKRADLIAFGVEAVDVNGFGAVIRCGDHARGHGINAGAASGVRFNERYGNDLAVGQARKGRRCRVELEQRKFAFARDRVLAGVEIVFLPRRRSDCVVELAAIGGLRPDGEAAQSRELELARRAPKTKRREALFARGKNNAALAIERVVDRHGREIVVRLVDCCDDLVTRFGHVFAVASRAVHVLFPKDQLGNGVVTGRRSEAGDGPIDVIGGRNVAVVAHDDRNVGVGHAVGERGILDERVLDQGVFDERVLDQGVLDERVLDQGILDERVLETVVLDQGILDERVLDQGILDERVLDQGVFDERVFDQRVLDQRIMQLRQEDVAAARDALAHAAQIIGLLDIAGSAYAADRDAAEDRADRREGQRVALGRR